MKFATQIHPEIYKGLHRLRVEKDMKPIYLLLEEALVIHLDKELPGWREITGYKEGVQ